MRTTIFCCETERHMTLHPLPVTRPVQGAPSALPRQHGPKPVLRSAHDLGPPINLSQPPLASQLRGVFLFPTFSRNYTYLTLVKLLIFRYSTTTHLEYYQLTICALLTLLIENGVGSKICFWVYII